ncbi:hypothetical protein [Halovivax gelatinilyticus]|uniref:hypothetical protein n=1 Tax=Halovivax gelatinilyticus TaxID=2961597 RepID=UPI0020CA7B11|nr:hypothetical protein [Halovivax gelatinilyticus]
MADVPARLRTFDIERTDDLVRQHLVDAYVNHPTRGTYCKSRVLYESLEDDLEERFSLELFGLFCESRPYLEKWSRGYGGSYRYRILVSELE